MGKCLIDEISCHNLLTSALCLFLFLFSQKLTQICSEIKTSNDVDMIIICSNNYIMYHLQHHFSADILAEIVVQNTWQSNSKIISYITQYMIIILFSGHSFWDSPNNTHCLGAMTLHCALCVNVFQFLIDCGTSFSLSSLQTFSSVYSLSWRLL